MLKNSISRPVLRNLGVTDYLSTWQAMQEFTSSRDTDTSDEIWLTEHPPVYTLGLNRRGVSLPLRSDIPLVETDRGGKITYHGPGQVVVYLLLDLNRLNLAVKPLVQCIENIVVEALRIYQVEAELIEDAPGVYVGKRKIASLGLRVKRGCSYHGFSLNVDMDLSPFSSIDPCGFKGLEVTQLRNLGVSAATDEVTTQLAHLCERQISFAQLKGFL
ncbi:octanoyltransferase [Methylobacillus sp. MM3]|jgi:lipoyl(octanoyl) transferase|nr:lipoyl(octanoyl) transferase LipB [Methylobacillus sp. MM3]OAJ69718.1 octanoyltransferase [Methylobacillus sp. MM3]